MVNTLARRCGPSWLRDDVVSETKSRLLESFLTGVAAHELLAYATRVVRSVVRVLLQQEILCPSDVEALVDQEELPTFDQLVARPPLPHTFLRGAVQKQLVDLVSAGQCTAAISATLGMEEKEARRRVNRLAELVRLRRQQLEESSAESPPADFP